MIGWLLDTHVIGSLMAANGAPSVKAWAASQDERRMHISVLVLAEYDKGIHNLAETDPSRIRRAQVLAALQGRFDGRILSVSDAVVRRWGTISGTVKRTTGAAPSVIDTLMAATALEADLYLVTRNVRDVARSGATVFNPWTDDPNDFRLGSKKAKTAPV